MFLHGSSSVGPKPPGKNSGAGFALTFHSLQATLPLHLSLPLSTAAASHQQQASSHHHHQQQHASSSSSATASNVRDREAAKATNKTPGTPSTPSGSDSGLGLTTEMAYKKKRLKRNRLFCRAPIASFDCMEDGMLSTDSSLTPNPPSRQLSLCYPQGIKYKNLGKTGLRISSLGLGTWVTFGSQISEETAEEILTAAYESGITVFDTADVYAGGKAEMVLGNVLKKKGWRRSSYIVNTKLFWGKHFRSKPDSERGLSRKHIIEGLQASLERLQLSYVDIVFANKADPMCPMEEIVRAFTHCINQGWAMYWGTSRWSAMDIMESYTVARQFNLIPPVVEQTEYHMFQREKVELHLPELYHKIGVGTITWSPQAFGVLTGKFDEGVQLLSRGSVRQQSFTACHEKISSEESGRSPRHQSKMQELTYLADKLGCTPTQLTIAWCLKNEGVQCVLVGAFSVEQLYDNLQALQVVPKLTSNILNEVEKILDNKPVRQPVQR